MPLERGVAISSGTLLLRMLLNLHLPWQMAKFTREAMTDTFIVSMLTRVPSSGKHFVNGDLPFTFGDIVLKSSPVVSGGIVYIGSLDGYLYALDANNGNISLAD